MVVNLDAIKAVSLETNFVKAVLFDKRYQQYAGINRVVLFFKPSCGQCRYKTV